MTAIAANIPWIKNHLKQLIICLFLRLLCIFLYFERNGSYTRALNRGLSIPGDFACQWTIFCYIIFNLIEDHVCRVSLIDIFQKKSDFYMFNTEEQHCHILANLIISKYCLTCCPKTHKETGQKVLKLS